jgi:hypothetical protein
MTWSKRDIRIVRGEPYVHVVEFEEDPLSWTYRAQLRLDPMNDEGDPDAVFDVDDVDLPITGELYLNLTETQTEALDPLKVYRWNLERIDEVNAAETIVGGLAYIEQKVNP